MRRTPPAALASALALSVCGVPEEQPPKPLACVSTADLSAGGPLAVAAALLPDRWGLAAASLTDLRHVMVSAEPTAFRESLWDHTAGQWLFDLGMRGLLAVAYALAATVILSHRLSNPRPATRQGVGWG